MVRRTRVNVYSQRSIIFKPLGVLLLLLYLSFCCHRFTGLVRSSSKEQEVSTEVGCKLERQGTCRAMMASRGS